MSIASEITRLQQAKSDLATSIAAKGVTVPVSSTLDDYPALVDQIQTGGSLPYDSKVEYLESRNGAYIDTGIGANTNYVVTCRFRLVNANTNLAPFGYWADNATAFRVYWRNQSSKFYYQYKTVSASQTSVSTKNNWHNVFFGNGLLVIDGVSYTGTSYTYNNPDVLFTLFGAYTNNSSGSHIPGVEMNSSSSAFIQIAYFTIALNGKLLRSYIPVRVGQVGYMYDTVSGTLFGNNAGTGSFSLGPDVGTTLPYDSEIEYLQGDGSAYIDTEIVDKGQYDIIARVGYTIPTTSNQYANIYGYNNGWATKSRAVRIQQGSKLYIWYNNTESNVSLSSTNVTIEDTPTAVKADGTTLSSRSSANIDNTYNLFLFARNSAGSPNFGSNTASIASLKFYSFLIYNGNTLLIDLIPVRVGTVGYMYDRVSGRLFGNANSTGAFTLGPDVT